MLTGIGEIPESEFSVSVLFTAKATPLVQIRVEVKNLILQLHASMQFVLLCSYHHQLFVVIRNTIIQLKLPIWMETILLR